MGHSSLQRYETNGASKAEMEDGEAQSKWTKESMHSANSNKNWLFQRPVTSHGLKSVNKHWQIRQ